MSYVPGGRLGRLYFPSSSVVALNCVPFVALMAVTVAPATGPPVDFVTVPETIPRSAGIFIPGMFGIGACPAGGGGGAGFCCASAVRAPIKTTIATAARRDDRRPQSLHVIRRSFSRGCDFGTRQSASYGRPRRHVRRLDGNPLL